MKISAVLLLGLFCGQSQIYAAPRVQKERDAVETIVLLPQHSLWLRALRASGQDQTLRGHGPFTVLAPINGAWGKLPPRVVKALFLPANKPLLSAIVRFHILPRSLDGNALASLPSGTNVRTLEGETLAVRTPIVVVDPKCSASAKFESFNFRLRNGVMHQIDTVLLPTKLVSRVAQLDTSGGR